MIMLGSNMSEDRIIKQSTIYKGFKVVCLSVPWLLHEKFEALVLELLEKLLEAYSISLSALQVKYHVIYLKVFRRSAQL